MKSYMNKLTKFLQTQRPILNGTIGEYLIVFLAYFIIIIPLTAFVLFHISTQIFSTPGDATAGFLWLNDINHTIDPFISFTSLTNYPFGEAAGGITLVSYLAYWFPMRILSFIFNPIAALNIVMFFGYSSAAMMMYWLVKRLTGRRSIAFFAGYAVAFVPYAMMKSVEHFSYIFSGVFSGLIAVFLAFWQRPDIKKGVVFACFLALACYTDGYFILMAVLLVTGMLVAGFVYTIIWREHKELIIKRLVGVGIALISFIILISPLLVIQMTQGSHVTESLGANRSAIGRELQIYKSKIADFVLPPQDNILVRNNAELLNLHNQNNKRSNYSENNNYISPLLYALCVVGLLLAIHRVFTRRKSKLIFMSDSKWRMVTLVIFLCVITCPLLLSFMFSPGVTIHGIYIALPGQYLIDHNIALWRVMSRLFVVFNVLIVLASALSLWMIATKFTQYKEVFSKYALVGVGVCLAIIIISYTCYFSARPFDFSTKLPQTYYWLQRQSSIKSIAELPVVDSLDMYTSDYATAQIVHGKATMNLKGAGDSRINNTLGSLQNPELINLIQDRGVDAVLVRSMKACEAVSWGSLKYHEAILYFSKTTRTTTRTNLCTYFVTPTATSDPVFVRFSQGFVPSPNAIDQSNIVLGDGGEGKLMFTRDDFETAYKGTVRLTAILHNSQNSGDSWQLISTDGKLLAQGDFANDGLAFIDTTIQGETHVELKITNSIRPIMLGQVYVSNVIASRVN